MSDIELALLTLEEVCQKTSAHAGCNRCELFTFCQQKEQGASISFAHRQYRMNKLLTTAEKGVRE